MSRLFTRYLIETTCLALTVLLPVGSLWFDVHQLGGRNAFDPGLFVRSGALMIILGATVEFRLRRLMNDAVSNEMFALAVAGVGGTPDLPREVRWMPATGLGGTGVGNLDLGLRRSASPAPWLTRSV